MEETRNWVEMPDEIMGGMIFPRLGTLEILKNVEKVCTTWQRICKDDPEMWKIIVPISAKDIEAIGRNCPHLQSFKIWIPYLSYHGIAPTIANSMPALRHLELIGSRGDNDGVRAILNGCPHLESLHILNCFRVDPNLIKLCTERIRDFQFSREVTPETDEDSDKNDFYDLSDDD
ncbi:hypothetical protein OSB04_001858 [Centaurea solstitialis]|uniref:Uncharacterized protein n=1 Tax=Centaurea solstitialis TaxID=347529 RepID=A0AA38WLT4_9ASTR|nr:hypothetical protein OSB04_001858 [Centaurea solstitialis]